MKLINKNIESAFLPIKGGSQSANPCTELVEVCNLPIPALSLSKCAI